MNIPVPAPRKRDLLITTTCVFVIIAVLGYAFETVRQYVAAAAAAARAAAAGSQGPRPGKLETSSYTNAEAAHVTITNLNAFDVESCFRAVVTREDVAGGRVESVPVCTGLMKPRTTIVLQAPYRIGAVEALCPADNDRFNLRRIDWSKCSFTTEEVR